MFIKKCDFKCIKILAKCDTLTEYLYCCQDINSLIETDSLIYT
jgi:hypothetical protein